MTEREAFEAWAKQPPMEWGCDRFPDNGAWPGSYRYYPAQCAWEGWQAARAQTAQAVPASCGECGKKTSDGWALYCVACMEKAGLPAVTDSPPLMHSCTSSLGKTPDSTARKGPLLSEDDMLRAILPLCHGDSVARLLVENSGDEYRAIEQAVRAKMGVAVPMTDPHLQTSEERRATGERIMSLIEKQHPGIVGKEGA